ncbi:MAG: sulfite exporter TauE/SafE family protein [Clostridiales bacterium]|nr:sulfite exporter TauE/SafE family protein [Clostridiales bacterium]
MKCAVAGALAGTLNGVFGAGGGMLLVPLLLRWVKMDERKAFATSVFIILPLCVVSAIVYLLKTRVDFLLALPYLIGGLIGGFIGGCCFRNIPTALLRRAFGLLLIYGGIRCLIQ